MDEIVRQFVEDMNNAPPGVAVAFAKHLRRCWDGADPHESIVEAALEIGLTTEEAFDMADFHASRKL